MTRDVRELNTHLRPTPTRSTFLSFPPSAYPRALSPHEITWRMSREPHARGWTMELLSGRENTDLEWETAYRNKNGGK